MTNNFFNVNDFFKDNYIPKNKLIQTFEYRFDKDFDEEFKDETIVILCYNLYIDKPIINNSGNITIFCRNLYCEKDAKIDVSGKENETIAGEKPVATSQNPNGTHADNKDLNGNDIPLKGENGGNIKIYAENIFGKLELLANGGKGARGQKGGDAIQNRNGNRGREVRAAEYSENYDLKLEYGRGEDGGPPTVGGDGAIGGTGGDAGIIIIGYENWKFFDEYSEKQSKIEAEIKLYEILKKENAVILPPPQRLPNLHSANGGFGGEGGKEGKGNKGGAGGPGGPVYVWGGGHELPDEEQYWGDGHPGLDRSTEIGANGRTGKQGELGNRGTIEKSVSYLKIVNSISSSFLRVIILSGEELYINNQIEKAAEVFHWILSFKEFLKNNPDLPKEKLSEYLNDESVESFEPFFSKATVYLNQINQGADFFGNVTNYITLLDSESINDKIHQFRVFVESYEKLIEQVFKKDLDDNKQDHHLTQIKTALQNNISVLQQENSRLVNSLSGLNEEIKNRMAEIPDWLKRIEDKRDAFENAVRDSNGGCSFEETLGVITKVVTIAVAIYSGVGAVGAVATILSGTTELVSDFSKKVDKNEPGFSPAKWKELFDKEEKEGEKVINSSLVKKIEQVKEATTEFTNGVKAIGKANELIKGEEQSLVAIPNANTENPSKENKTEFINEMKKFIGKYPEAKLYQDEVLSFFDFCDITNQKRLQFTNNTLSIIQNQNTIEIYVTDKANVSSQSFDLKNSEISSEKKWMFLDTYLKMKQFYLKLLYLHSKSIDFLRLENTPFRTQAYSYTLVTLGSNYAENLSRLVEEMESSDVPKILNNFKNPIIINEHNYPISFEKFKNQEKDSRGWVSIRFTIPPNAPFLDGTREIKIISTKVYIKGAKTNSGTLEFYLEHGGNSSFVKTDESVITFNHRTVGEPFQFDLTTEKYDEDKHFGKLIKIINDKGVASNYQVGVSPFASWEIQIPDTESNKGLDLSKIKNIELHFEYKSIKDN